MAIDDRRFIAWSVDPYVIVFPLVLLLNGDQKIANQLHVSFHLPPIQFVDIV
ncbi:hypothetical protein T8J41_19545 (plasmid) [Nitratireductor rhodophyticola]|uniref:hypothetical protein n=1 Tax=Nitratireductor TaxID=245876 RepID=UPI001CA74D9B|nr:hypothetical protein [Nitratireductor rhodophyticola]WPZ16391.1 hypothetical protein T8J41_19545 [Nitratireductor rhodophyticola]